MPQITGTSERGAQRNLSINDAGSGLLRVRIFHPNGRSGAVTHVQRHPFMLALTGAVTTLPGVDADSGKPIRIERRHAAGRDQFHVWIQGTSANGWSIICDADDLAACIPGERVAGA